MMKEYFEITNFVGRDGWLPTLYLELVSLFYVRHCTPSMNFVAIRRDVYNRYTWKQWCFGEATRINEICEAIDAR